MNQHLLSGLPRRFVFWPSLLCALLLLGPLHAGARSPQPELAAGADVASLSSLRRVRPPADATLLVGPEGGWTDGEVATARASGLQLVTMGHRTLRADATPVAAISVLQFLFGDL